MRRKSTGSRPLARGKNAPVNAGHGHKHPVTYWVHALAASLARRAARVYAAKFKLRLPEVRILSNLGTYGRLASRDIVALTAMDKGLVSRALSGLVERGWVRMVATDDRQRRRLCVLTPSGEALVEKLRPVWQERENFVQNSVSAAEQELLAELLERLFHASEDMREKEARALSADRKSRRGSSAGARPRKVDGAEDFND